MFKYYSFIGLLMCAAVFTFAPYTAADEGVEQIPQSLKPNLDQLLSLALHDHQARPDMTVIQSVVDYVLTPKDPETTYSAGLRNGATSNYYEFTIHRSMEDVIELTYNPDIPSYFFIPASLHQSRWTEVNGKQQPFPDLSKTWPALSDPPLLIKGVETVENTPDTYSGAYYAYTMDRGVVLTSYQGRRVLLSMSVQRGKSDVGKKGLVLGNDDDWNYIYTGENGCTRTGLGWADTYMYGSESVAVYYEMTEPVPHVRCAVFKWVHAGWAGINMAQTIHIKNGVERFVRTFKKVIESPALPRPSELAAVIRRIENAPTPALREEVRDYFRVLKARHENDNRLTRKWLGKLFENDDYLNKMDREELTAAVCTEYLKYLLGKTHGFDIAFLEKAKIPSRHPG